MPRQPRTKSVTGIYHVMLRGINRQPIFEQESDYRKFIDLLRQMVSPTDELGKPLPQRCVLYAYCLMPNHVHLLIQEKAEDLSTVIWRIASTFAMYYNVKYEHFGHLFQDRFRSEPVNDVAYFYTLIRYIHQNPIAGGLCENIDYYEWSSWGEYMGHPRYGSPICATSSVLKRIPLKELDELVRTPLPKAASILDFDKRGCMVSDEEVRAFLTSTYGLNKPTDLQLYSKERRDEILDAARNYGASIRQLSRLTSIGIKIIRKAH